MEKLLNVENDRDGEVDCPEMTGPSFVLTTGALISEKAAIKGLQWGKQLVLLVW